MMGIDGYISGNIEDMCWDIMGIYKYSEMNHEQICLWCLVLKWWLLTYLINWGLLQHIVQRDTYQPTSIMGWDTDPPYVWQCFFSFFGIPKKWGHLYVAG